MLYIVFQKNSKMFSLLLNCAGKYFYLRTYFSLFKYSKHSITFKKPTIESLWWKRKTNILAYTLNNLHTCIWNWWLKWLCKNSKIYISLNFLIILLFYTFNTCDFEILLIKMTVITRSFYGPNNYQLAVLCCFT